MEISDSLIEKIQKLIAKEASARDIGNLEEAEAFAIKVSDLLLKYNLSRFNIKEKVNKSTIINQEFPDIFPRNNEGLWIFDLYHIITKHNLCKLIITTYRTSNLTVPTQVANIFGEKQDIEVVVFLGKQLEYKFRYLAKLSYKQFRYRTDLAKNKFIRSFLRGAVIGLNSKLKAMREQQKADNQNTMALVLYRDEALKEAIERAMPDLSRAKKRPIEDNLAVSLGYQAGKEIDINKGLNNKEDKNILN